MLIFMVLLWKLHKPAIKFETTHDLNRCNTNNKNALYHKCKCKYKSTIARMRLLVAASKFENRDPGPIDISAK